MNLIDHIKLGRQGIIHRLDMLSETKPVSANDIIIGYLTGLSGCLDGKRRVKLDNQDSALKHWRSRSILIDFCNKHDIFTAKDWTRVSAAFTCVLYQNGKLTRTVNPYKPVKVPDNPVGYLCDASTGGNEYLSKLDSAALAQGSDEMKAEMEMRAG